jgi:hypothetical protein
MDVGYALVAGCEATKLAEPRERALHQPPVPPELGTALDATTGDAGLDVAAGQSMTAAAAGHAAAMIISLVGVELAGPALRRSPGLLDRWHSNDHLLQHDTVVNVGSCQQDRERDALCIREDVPLGARLATISGVRACC